MGEISARMLVPEDVVVNGHRVAYGDHGPADGAPVTLIHGTPSSSVIWRNVVPSLVADGHRVVVLDLLGYGASERPADPQVDTSVSAQVDVVLAVLTAQGVESAHIVAHDIGGGVAQRLGVLHPGRMRSLVLIDSVSFDSWPSERTRRQMQAGLDALTSANGSCQRSSTTPYSPTVRSTTTSTSSPGPSVRPASISIRSRTTTPATPTSSPTESLSSAACPCT
jgi:pimeloyl-ACP methyl ester carboxylesterase